MKLKTNNAVKKSTDTKKNKSPKKQAKGVEVRKEKTNVIKPTVLKKEAEKTKVETSSNPRKILQVELWNNAIKNISNLSDLSDDESNIAKLLADYQKKASIPQKKIKLKNFITKGFSKFKNTNDEVLDGIYDKILNEYKSLGGNNIENNSKNIEKKSKEEASDEDMNEEEGDDDDVDDEEEDGGGDIVFDESDNDDKDSEEENPKSKAKNKNGKSQSKKGKNNSKFISGKVQKNKKFGKKK